MGRRHDAKDWATCHPTRKHYAKGLCKFCHGKEWRATNPHRIDQSQRNSNFIRSFGITLDQYELMLKLQGGVCKLCERPPQKRRLSVDHDHSSGRVRGLLCFVCNRLRVGPAKDSEINLYKKIVAYLGSKFDGRTLKAEAKITSAVRRRRKAMPSMQKEFLSGQDA